MDPVKLIIKIIILAIVIYCGVILFQAMVTSLWAISPITSVGFVISVIVAFLKGVFSFDKLENNLVILGFIFVGTVLSYAATSLIPTGLKSLYAGDFVGAAIIIAVILVIWFKGQEIKNLGA